MTTRRNASGRFGPTARKLRANHKENCGRAANDALNPTRSHVGSDLFECLSSPGSHHCCGPVRSAVVRVTPKRRALGKWAAPRRRASSKRLASDRIGYTN